MPETDDILSDAERHALATVTVGGMAQQQVLIVEDNRDSREALASYLKAHGIRCLTAANTVQALACLHREAGIGLLITDLRMQPVDGLELIRQIRESKRADLPIIIVSGDAETQDAIAAMHLSVVDFLLKPIDVEKLLKLVRHELGIG
ncbi:response regulator [Pseudomonas aegrilactucae]|uniref:Response regulator n=1 Tax=Pseudomonas aegrilactucae TaxID=2854028 RepID=A0A9Q3AC84_9PSED|nr:response regulator [Pseudomonas aegrilactucae]MBV6285753.1 response regulator [Pseudomonas aegrilactucae]